MVMVFKNIPPIKVGRLMFNFGGTEVGESNIIPFRTILSYLNGGHGWLIATLNLAGNIVLLVPIGFLVPFVYTAMTGKKSFFLAIATGFAIEGTQVLLRVGIFDIDDVILNALGVMVGYWIFILFFKLLSLYTKSHNVH